MPRRAPGRKPPDAALTAWRSGVSIATMKLAERPYGPESTPEEIKAIEACIYVLADGVLMYKEVPIPSIFQLDIFERRMTELGDRSGYRLIIDLTEAQPPSAAIRERLKRLFGGQPLRRVAVFTGKNFMLNIAAKFVLGGIIGLKNVSIHKTREEAVDAVNV
jgi:hypothetical protein